MPSKAKKPAKPVPEAPHSTGAWRPEMETQPEFNPFASTGATGDGRTQFGENGQEPPVPDALQDTAPLQGTRDMSDADSLRDVLAAAATPTPRAKSSGRRRAARAPARKSRAAKTRRSAPRRAAPTKRRSTAKRSKTATKAKAAARTRRGAGARRPAGGKRARRAAARRR